MKELPKLYKNEDKSINTHNIISYHITNNKEFIDNKEKVLEEIFNSTKHPYNIKVFIKTDDKSYETYIISKKNNMITTIENKTLNIDEIKFIKILKN